MSYYDFSGFYKDPFQEALDKLERETARFANQTHWARENRLLNEHLKVMSEFLVELGKKIQKDK